MGEKTVSLILVDSMTFDSTDIAQMLECPSVLLLAIIRSLPHSSLSILFHSIGKTRVKTRLDNGIF